MIKRHSLVWQIALSFGLLLVLAMGGLSWFLSSYFHNSYQSLLEQNLSGEARLVASRVAVRLAEDSSNSTVGEIVHTYADSLNVRVTIINQDGVVLGESSLDPREMENHLNRPEVQGALRGQVTTATRYSSTLKGEMLYAAAPVMHGEQVQGVARLAISTQVVDENLGRIQRTIISATAAVLLAGLLMAYLLASYTTRPIEELTGEVRNFSGGALPSITPPAARMRSASSTMPFTRWHSRSTSRSASWKPNAASSKQFWPTSTMGLSWSTNRAWCS